MTRFGFAVAALLFTGCATTATPTTGIPFSAYVGEAPYFNATTVPSTFHAPPWADATTSGTGR